MADDSNISFCLLHTPNIAAQLKALPRTSRERRLIGKQIEALSRASLMAADRLFGLWTKSGISSPIWRDNGNPRS
jgi:hypothetical protein